MKRIILIISGLLATIILIVALASCQRVPITPGVIDVKFDDIVWENDKVVADIYITNGKLEDQYVDLVEFALYLPDDVTEFCSAGYEIKATIETNSYVKYEIEFTSEFINMSKSDFNELEISLDDLIMHFWYRE